MHQGNVLKADVPVLPMIAAGQQHAVAECIDRYANLVWALARRSCPDTETAEDAVQDIFLKLWKAAGRFDPEIASESTFVAMIARRCLIDLSRKRRWETSDEGLDRVAEMEMNAAERVELNDEAAKAKRVLETLPVDQKTVIKLSVYEGLSHSLIAETTGLSLGTVKTHIRRGMLRLRESLFPAANDLVVSQVNKGETA